MSLSSKAKAVKRPARKRLMTVTKDELQLALDLARGEITLGQGAASVGMSANGFYAWVGRKLMAAVNSELLIENPEKIR